ncbi:unnamed protein product, partial [Heterosigma akashiwo]
FIVALLLLLVSLNLQIQCLCQPSQPRPTGKDDSIAARNLTIVADDSAGFVAYHKRNCNAVSCPQMQFISLANKWSSRGPIALATFPGSGNTWMRHLLERLTGFYTCSVYCDKRLKSSSKPLAAVCDAARRCLVVKTHYPAVPMQFSIETEGFSKAVVLLRDPRKAVMSWQNFLITKSHIKGIQNSTHYWNNTDFYESSANLCMQWSNFHRYWAEEYTGPVLWITYEDMMSSRAHVYERLLDFLDI